MATREQVDLHLVNIMMQGAGRRQSAGGAQHVQLVDPAHPNRSTVTSISDEASIRRFLEMGYVPASSQQVTTSGGRPSSPTTTAPTSVADGGDGTSSAALRRRTAAEYTNQLRQDGLDDLEEYVDDWVEEGLTWPEILARLDDYKTPEGEVIDKLYPARRRIREAGGTPPTISQIRFYRERGAAMMRVADMPATFYDEPGDFDDWIVAGVDLPELQERVNVAVDWTQNISTEHRTQLEELYQVGAGGIAAYVLDKDKGLAALQRAQAAAGASAAAVRAKFGPLTRAEAERLISLGVTAPMAEQAFGALDQSRELRAPLTGQRGTALMREQELAAVGGDADVLEKLRRAGAGQRGAFGGGGGLSESREGISGFGAAKR